MNFDKKQLNDYYGKQMARYGTKDFTLYGTRASQIERFMLAPMYALSKMGGSLLDVGCGVGEFYEWLEENKLPMPNYYVGTEVMDEIYAKARERHPKLDIRLIDVVEEDAKDIGSFDVITAFSVSAVKLGNLQRSDEYWLRFVEKCFSMLNDGGVFIWNNFSPEKTEIRDEDYIVNPMEIYKFAKRLTERVIIDHSYMPHDFALIMYKGDSRWRKEWKRTGGWSHV